MGKNDSNETNDSKDITVQDLQQIVEKQENTIARLENEIKKVADPNDSPRIIQKGRQRHPKFQSNNNKIPATLPKEK